LAARRSQSRGQRESVSSRSSVPAQMIAGDSR
jgi:hypothetical protein